MKSHFIEYTKFNGKYIFLEPDNKLATKIGVTEDEFEQLMVKDYNAAIFFRHIYFKYLEDIERAVNYLQPIVDSYYIIKTLEHKEEDMD